MIFHTPFHMLMISNSFSSLYWVDNIFKVQVYFHTYLSVNWHLKLNNTHIYYKALILDQSTFINPTFINFNNFASQAGRAPQQLTPIIVGPFSLQTLMTT